MMERDPLNQELDDLRADNERLRAAGKIEQAAWDKLVADRDRLRAALGLWALGR